MIPHPGEGKDGWRRAARIGGLAVRIVLLLVLLWGALVVALSLSPSPRTPAEFRAAVAAGHVSDIRYRVEDGNVRSLRWAEGPLNWHEIDVLSLGDGSRAYTSEEFWREVSGLSVEPVQMDGRTNRGGIIPDWPFEAPLPRGAWVIGAAWVVTFLIMLGSVPRLGNRWAWFWLFTVGQIGAILFLLLEPRSLWSGAGERPVPKGRLTGGQGCLMSIGLSILAGFAALGVGALVRLVLG
ncbi:hypothetical protein [Streptosporangium sp. NPDC000396]|uniref:hypothetical protein n=1 Tax=Streptosporangium sp. NPDC000396 TaxID=3366185 RepID=UPI003686FFB9